MINLTVKTLDSQNHSFSLEDDITVRGFKEQIAESVGVPAESQRLIYCGRVLQDEKKLIEYDVNGKVIHLVQRVPPQIGQRGNNSGQGQDQGQRQGQGTNRPHYFRHTRGQVHIPRFDGNTMYLGAMSFPADGDGQGPAPPPLCPRQSVRRLAVARRMFSQVNRTINRLDDPTSQATANSNTSAANQEQAQEQSQDQSQGAGNDQEQEPTDAAFEIAGGVAGAGGLAQAASVAINAALSETGLDDFAAFSAALNSFTFLRRRNEGANPSVIRVHIQRNNGEGGESGNTSSPNDTEQQEQSQPAQRDEQQPEAQSESQSQPQTHQQEQPQSQQQEQQQQQQPQQPQQQPQQQQQSQEEAQTQAQDTDAEGPRNSRVLHPNSRPQAMVEFLNRVLRTHDRLRPYIEHYRDLMSRDPVLSTGGGPNSVEENQRIIDGVSETLHFLSHAYHALSDIIVDLNQPPPRNLTARPFVTQHSALLQAGIPIQVEAHISLHGRNQNNNNDNGSPTAPSSAEGANAAESGEFDGPPNENNDGSVPLQESESANQQSQAFGTVFNVPHNVEVLMEMSPEMGGTEQGQQNFNNRNNNNNGNPEGISAGIFPWGATPPPDFMRNLMQAVAGHMTLAVPTSTTGNPPASTSAEQPATNNEGTATVTAPNVEGANTNPSQSTQARGNTGTHPTTSTQTRSTPRPHVFHSNVHPLNMGLAPGRVFDAFLPCKSHHVRPNPITILNSSPNTASAQQNQANQNSTTTEPTQTATSIPTADSAPSSETAQGNQTPTMPSSSQNVPFVQLLTQLLSGAGAQTGQVTAGPAGFMQMFSNAEGIPVIQGMMSNGSGQSGGINLIDLLAQVSGVNASANNGSGGQAGTNQTSQGDDLVFDLIVAVGTVLQNMTSSEWEALRLGIWEPLAGIRNILREFFQNFFGSTSLTGAEEQVANRLIAALHPIIEQVLANEANERDNSERSIDLPATIEGLIKRHFINILRLLFDEDADEARFVQGMLASMWSLQMESSSVIQYSFREQPIHVDTLANRIATRLTDGVEPGIRQWIVTNLRPHITSFFQNTIPLLDREVIPLLVYKDIPSATTSTPIVERSTPVQQAQPIPEPMETGAIEEIRELESLDTEEMEPFPGQDAVPSDWVPIISRDRVRQRRQLQSQIQMQGMTGSGVGGFSDAYLGGMPSKRRKLIEQQKPRILLSPTMERLVRDSTGRAGIEEVEGAAAAVATDAGVRRAFGQAIRGCLYENPRRQTAPDFPDPLRFPNATKYFANSDETSKK